MLTLFSCQLKRLLNPLMKFHLSKIGQVPSQGLFLSRLCWHYRLDRNKLTFQTTTGVQSGKPPLRQDSIQIEYVVHDRIEAEGTLRHSGECRGHSLSLLPASFDNRIPELRDLLSHRPELGESTSIWCPITKAVSFLSFGACAVEGNLVAARVSLLAVPLLLAIVSRPKLQIWLRFRLASELFTGAAAASQSRSPAECPSSLSPSTLLGPQSHSRTFSHPNTTTANHNKSQPEDSSSAYSGQVPSVIIAPRCAAAPIQQLVSRPHGHFVCLCSCLCVHFLEDHAFTCTYHHN